MNALVAKRKVLSAIVIVLILMSLAVPVALAAPPPPLSLPPGQVIASHSLLFDPADPTWPAGFKITFSGFSGNYNVATGTPYPGWCLEDDMPTPDPTIPNIFFYSSYDPNMPPNAMNYTDPATPKVLSGEVALGSLVPWDRLNYLLNHKLGTIQEVQSAIWLLMWGSTSLPVTGNVTAMVIAANSAAAAGFVPAAGQIIAVLLYDDGIGFNFDLNFIHQESIIELTVTYYDLGDLPQPQPATPTYPTLLANAPSHQLGQNLLLGVCVDAETDGQPDTPATGDDTAVGSPVFGQTVPPCTDDEDGVVRTPNVNWQNGVGGGSVNVTVAGGPGCLSGWIDWNGNGNLTDAGDNILDNILLGTGTSTRTFTVPVPPGSGTFYSRFRLYPTDPGGVCTSAKAPTGPAIGGEVEDYRWSFSPNAVTLSQLQATTVSTSERLMALLRSWLQQR